MSNEIGPVTDILTRSFYRQSEEENGFERYQMLASRSSIGQSEETKEHFLDKWMAHPLLDLPILSYDEFRNFLLNGREWFTNFTANAPVSSASDQLANQKHKAIVSMLNVWHQALIEQSEGDRAREKERAKEPTFLEEAVAFEMIRMQTRGPEAIGESEQRVAALMAYAAGPFQSVSQAWEISRDLVPGIVRGDLGAAVGVTASLASLRSTIILPVMIQQTGEGLSPQAAQAYGYATMVVKHIYSDGFVQDVSSQVLAKCKDCTPKQLQKIISAMRLTLLVNALSALYKTETGGLTSIEIGDMIQGKLSTEENSSQSALVQLIQTELKHFSAPVQARLLEGILTYCDQDPDVEELFDTGKAFNGILGSSTNEHTIRQSI